MIVLGRAESVVRRPSAFAVLAAVGLVGLGALLLSSRERPPTPEPREGTSFVAERPDALVDASTEPATFSSEPPRLRFAFAAAGQVLVHDAPSTVRVLDADRPVTQPLLTVEGGIVAVSRGRAVFLPADAVGGAVDLGPATEVFVDTDANLWISHNDNGPQYVERRAGPRGPAERIDLGFGVLVHGIADSGLLLGRSGATEVVSPDGGEVVTTLPTFTEVLAVGGDVVVGTDRRCDGTTCRLLVVDAATGAGGAWDLGRFRLPNRPVAELSPSGSHLAIWIIDSRRDLAVGVVDLSTGEMQRGAVVGSSRRSADLSWSPDGDAVVYLDPVARGTVRVLRPFDDPPSDVVVSLSLDAGEPYSVAAVP